ncbi:hypothetical protein BO70DRAFT_376411 [Aspergillus heteromorphus CBS 117.55]|uniref:GCN5-related N-acetyltransferase Rv2170-like domain-containing protein n=1 Tax=Aspergillus heteromorphus CBS 117.55 TaxID=1448321 RepID=A0A317X2L4_9EURO|nr:uncharacterized protein BO70DRAFT_376411 [Aspergillus heteromorphus CBS 117.55]PWY92806.1 hypothetical protein BO70DRAFT_376411 [Aspergillus heteromorphus CBS 117.55]
MPQTNPNNQAEAGPPVYALSPHSPTTQTHLLPLLRAHLPYSLPLLRRIQHEIAHPSPHARILTTLSGLAPASSSGATSEPESEPESKSDAQSIETLPAKPCPCPRACLSVPDAASPVTINTREAGPTCTTCTSVHLAPEDPDDITTTNSKNEANKALPASIPSPASASKAKNQVIENDDEPWLIAYIDLPSGRETQAVVYCNLEHPCHQQKHNPSTVPSSSSSSSSSKNNIPDEKDKQTIKEDLDDDQQDDDDNNNTGKRISALPIPTHSHTLHHIRAQFLALLGYIKSHLLPEYRAVQAAAGMGANGNGNGNAIVKDHQIPPPPDGAYLFGNLHTGVFGSLFSDGGVGYSLPSQSDGTGTGQGIPGAEPEAEDEREFVPEVKVHRYDRVPYVKYLFREGAFAKTKTKTKGDGEKEKGDLPTGFRFSDAQGREGVQRRDLGLVRSRTVIPRSEETLAILPSAAVYRDSSSAAAGSGVAVASVGEEEGEGKKSEAEPESESPIAWAFLGPDGSLATLHVETPYRGQGLAGCVAREAMRRGMKDIQREKEGERWVHANVAMENRASRRVMEKLGGELAWTVTWSVLEV